MLIIIYLYISLIYLTSNYINADGNLRIAFLTFGDLTNQFLSTIQPNDGLNLSVSLVKQYLGKNSSPPSDPLFYVNYFWKAYVGYIILIIIGVLFILIFTFVGLILCCCRCCCNRCGARQRGPSKTNTKRRRIILNVVLFLFSSMILVGSIVAMASNVILRDALVFDNSTTDQDGNLFTNLNSVFQSSVSYINYIAQNAQTDGYVVLQNTLNNVVTILSGTVNIFISTFLVHLNYNIVIDATNVVINTYKILVTSGQSLASISSLHQTTATQFNQYLQSVVQNITALLNDPFCNSPYKSNCDNIAILLQFMVLGFNMSNINYTTEQSIPSVTNGFNISDMEISLDTVKSLAINVTSQINSTVSGYIQNFANSLSANSTIFTTFNNSIAFKNTIINFINSFQSSLLNFQPDGSNSLADGFISNYYRYAFYSLIALGCVILLVILLFYIGLCFGMCGGPNFEDAPRCSKGSGSVFLMASIGFSFLFGWLIMLVVLIMFVTGGMLQTEACSYITNGSNTKPLATIDNLINASLSAYSINFTINGVTTGLPNVNILQSLLTRCNTTDDLITSFKIPTDYISSLSNVLYQQFVVSSLVSLIKSIRNYNLPNIDVSSLQNSTNRMRPVIDFLRSYNSNNTITELQKPVVKIGNINAFLTSIKDLVTLANNSGSTSFANSLISYTSQLSPNVANMNTFQTGYYQQDSAFTKISSNLSNQVNTMISVVSSLPSKTSDAITAAVTIANSTLSQNVSTLVNQTVFEIIKKLGNCQGLSLTTKAAISTLCTTVLIPFNNIWMGIGWFLLFIIPCIAVALKLHRLYRISHIEGDMSAHSQAYENTNHFLSEDDKNRIRSRRNQSNA